MVFSKGALLIAAAIGCTEAAVVSRISPGLEPVSDKKFFTKDYPNDVRPHAGGLAFGHPYPVVQDSGEFSSDFVKDENGDNGQWKAQMEYDTLRAKLRKEKKQAEKALQKKETEMKELEDAMSKEKQAETSASKAKADAAKAKADADKAQAEVDALDGKGVSGAKAGSNAHIDAATEKVKKEAADLVKCKQELEDAKANLKKLMEEKEALEKKEAADAEAAAKHHAGQKKAAQALADAEVKEVEGAKAKEAKLEAEEVTLKKEMEEEKAEHEAAKAKYEAEKLKVEKTKADLAGAEEKLRALRGEKLPSKSMAARPVAAFLAVFAAVVCTFVH